MLTMKSDSVRRVWWLVWRYNQQWGAGMPTQREIANSLNLSRGTVGAALIILEKNGALLRPRAQRASARALLWVNKPDQLPDFL